MKISCIGKYIREAVSIADRVTTKTQSLPVLNSICIEAAKNELIIRSTNLETAIEIKIPAKVEQSGTLVVSGKTLGAFLSHLVNETVFFENQKENLFIKTDKTQTTLRGFSSEEFPLFPKIEPTISFTIPTEELRMGIHRAIVAVSTSDIKPELASISWKLFKNTGKFSATDSFRLSEHTILSKKISFDSDISFLLPSPAAHELVRLLENNTKGDTISLSNEKDVMIELNKNQIVIYNKSIRFISRLTEGVFPDYEQIIPKKFSTEIIIAKDLLLQHIRFASVFVGKLNDITLSFEPQKKHVTIQASNPDVGDHMAHMEASLQGDEGNAKFNWRYLYDGINNIPTEYVTLGFNGDQSPLLIKGKGDQSYLYLAMPLKGL